MQVARQRVYRWPSMSGTLMMVSPRDHADQNHSIYHKGLPCTNQHHKKHSISPSKLIEGSISVDHAMTATYLLRALELQSTKESLAEMDLEVLADASMLLCDMFRYGKIRPRDPSRTSAPMRELSISPQLRRSSSFLNPMLLGGSQSNPGSAWNRGGKLAESLSDTLEAAMEGQGLRLYKKHSEQEGAQLPTSRTLPRIQDTTAERLDTILVCLYYICAIVSGAEEDPAAIDRSVAFWKKLLACHATFQDLQAVSYKPKDAKNGRSPVRQSSRISTNLEALVAKAERRLQLLTTASEGALSRSQGDMSSPRDILLRRDTSEYAGSVLLSPTSETSLHFNSTDSGAFSQDSPSSQGRSTNQSLDTLCSCLIPAPLSSKTTSGTQLQNKPKIKKRTTKFDIHESPTSVRSFVPQTATPGKEASRTAMNPALFRGLQKQSRNGLRQSLASQSMSSSYLSLAGLASSASSTAPDTGMRFGRVQGSMLHRQPSQVSLASTSTFGRRAWAGPSGKPISRLSNLSSASLHTLAPMADQQCGAASVITLPHRTDSGPKTGAAQVLSSLSAQSHTRPIDMPFTYSGMLRKAMSSLNSYFTANHRYESAESSKAKAELEKVAEQHDAEVENFYCWEADRTSSDEESLHSGSPSNKGDDDVDTSPVDIDPTAQAREEQARQTTCTAATSPAEPEYKIPGTSSRPIYHLSTSISSSHLHSSTPTSSPRRGRLPVFATAPPTIRAEPTPEKKFQADDDNQKTRNNSSSGNRHLEVPASRKPAKIDPLLAALEASSRVNVKSRCAVCGIQGINFPKCHKCGMTFCSRDCRVASGGESGRHVCAKSQSVGVLPESTEMSV